MISLVGSAESFFGTLQLGLLDRRTWSTCQNLASAIAESKRGTTRTGDTPIGNAQLSGVRTSTHSSGYRGVNAHRNRPANQGELIEWVERLAHITMEEQHGKGQFG
ncbi:hypothetical protein [Streptomyces sp. NPDC059165]|uniref:hypothetical protein n=1 Tax=Streptomyces sp. NPDC059165 TaxID=3346751 RepID=UPI0036C0EA8E